MATGSPVCSTFLSEKSFRWVEPPHQTEVGEAGEREQDLLGGGLQPVVLEEQGGELGEAAERSVLHHGDVVLLEVQALQLGELGEHVGPQNLTVCTNLNLISGQQQVVNIFGPALHHGGQLPVLTVQVLLPRLYVFLTLLSLTPHHSGPAPASHAAPGAPLRGPRPRASPGLG
ncbi:hypothetical protein EYF80_039433 [Liparis tanakae]|uniref:Uncharacterized protein n=1 Tax=Liparis tanakae TaxID=230148 RepID=A0A4Z2GAV8_9TELE|nr:hypothetical protein EYF80_039433 [Liparis tanakae]